MKASIQCRRALFALAVAALGAGACGDSAGRPPAAMDASRAPADASPDVPLSAEVGVATDTALSVSAFIETYCGLLAPCCGLAGAATDGFRCRAVIGEVATLPYRVPTAESCLAETRAVSATPTFCTEGFAKTGRLCARVFTGTLASKGPGEECRTDDECLLSMEGPVVCAGVGPVTGRCQVRVRGLEGALPCVATVDGPLTVPGGDPTVRSARGYLCHVADGLWCDETSQKCLKAKSPGQPCAAFGECGAVNYCDDARAACAARKSAGAPCVVDEECQSVFCGEDNRCGKAPGIHGALVRFCTAP